MADSDRTYWLDLFTGTTWDEYLEAGGDVSGFRESRWKTVQRMKPGDHLLCYLTGVSRFVGVLEVTGPAFQDDEPIWGIDEFPARIEVRPLITLTPETAVPVLELRDELSIFQNLKNPNRWSGAFRGSPAKWKKNDGEAVVEALREAERHPVKRPVDPKKLARRPKAVETSVGLVAEPEAEEVDVEPPRITDLLTDEAMKHTEVQWLLAKLGSEMGLSVWVARNDRGREWKSHKLADIHGMVDSIPVQFDSYTNRIIELIDVLWLQGNSIVGAFEIESTTSIYSGLLRMSDLISVQPNLSIPLFIVAPDERREKVIREINRPTFSRSDPPLVEVCQYIPFSALHDRLAQVGDLVRHLKPNFIQELAESAELDS